MLRFRCFCAAQTAKKDGKDHRYFSIVENRRLLGGKTTQRTVLYLGEISDQQQSAWRKTLEVFDENEQRYTTTWLTATETAMEPTTTEVGTAAWRGRPTIQS